MWNIFSAFIWGCLDCKAEATPGCSRAVCLLIILLLVLEPSEDPASLGLQEVTILVSLQGKNPATGDPVPDLNLACVD